MTYLTPEQVLQLNEKHGWFEFADAQSDVSKAFAQDAITMYELMRAAAPDLLIACKRLLVEVEWEAARADVVTDVARADIALAKAAIAKATGAA